MFLEGLIITTFCERVTILGATDLDEPVGTTLEVGFLLALWGRRAIILFCAHFVCLCVPVGMTFC